MILLQNKMATIETTGGNIIVVGISYLLAPTHHVFIMRLAPKALKDKALAHDCILQPLAIRVLGFRSKGGTDLQ